MKFIDAQKKLRASGGKGEHKMQEGVRAGQSDPQLLHGSRTTSHPRTLTEVRKDPTVPRAEIRELAEKLGVDLTTVKGSGVNGAILMKDVRDAANDLS